jgi:hypothetical protein
MDRDGWLNTYSHGEPIIREDLRHYVEEVLVVLVVFDREDGDLLQERLEHGRELALFPCFCHSHSIRIEHRASNNETYAH